MTHLSALTTELKSHTASYLPYQGLYSLRLTPKEMNNTASGRFKRIHRSPCLPHKSKPCKARLHFRRRVLAKRNGRNRLHSYRLRIGRTSCGYQHYACDSFESFSEMQQGGPHSRPILCCYRSSTSFGTGCTRYPAIAPAQFENVQSRHDCHHFRRAERGETNMYIDGLSLRV